jgi:hypothetical protein
VNSAAAMKACYPSYGSACLAFTLRPHLHRAIMYCNRTRTELNTTVYRRAWSAEKPRKQAELADTLGQSGTHVAGLKIRCPERGVSVRARPPVLVNLLQTYQKTQLAKESPGVNAGAVYPLRRRLPVGRHGQAAGGRAAEAIRDVVQGTADEALRPRRPWGIRVAEGLEA